MVLAEICQVGIGHQEEMDGNKYMIRKIFMLEPPPGSQIPKFVAATDPNGKVFWTDGMEHPESAYLQIPSGLTKTDRLLTTGNELVISENACNLLNRFLVDPAIMRCPLRFAPTSAVCWGKYYLWYTTIQHQILHDAAITRSFKGHVLSVYEWSVASSNLPIYDLFVGPTNRWFVTEKLVDAILESKLSGFGFGVVPCR